MTLHLFLCIASMVVSVTLGYSAVYAWQPHEDSSQRWQSIGFCAQSVWTDIGIISVIYAVLSRTSRNFVLVLLVYKGMAVVIRCLVVHVHSVLTNVNFCHEHLLQISCYSCHIETDVTDSLKLQHHLDLIQWFCWVYLIYFICTFWSHVDSIYSQSTMM